MKRQFAKDLKPKTPVSDIFFISSREIKDRRDGGQFLKLELADKTGSVAAVMWDNLSSVIDFAKPGTFVLVNGMVGEYNGKLQMTVAMLQPIAARDVKSEDFVAASRYSPDEMFTEIQAWFAEVKNPHLRRLVDNIFADPEVVRRFKAAPGGARVHHAFLGGLLEHTLFMLRASRSLHDAYVEVDYPLLVAGIILHDVGKIDEYEYEPAIDHTDQGRMLGHIVMGYRRVEAAIRELPEFPPELERMLLHMILSHHGTLEFGSPKTPKFVEAYLLHTLDLIDARVAMFRKSTADNATARWTEYDKYLETNVYIRHTPPAAGG
jgi:3'-5' exoribonuclease